MLELQGKNYITAKHQGSERKSGVTAVKVAKKENGVKSSNGICQMCASNITKAQLDTFMKNARHGSFSSSFADRFNYETYLNLYMKDFGYNENCNRRAHFLGQIAKETKFWSYNESFNYTKDGFDNTFARSAHNNRARAYARERAADPAVTYINQVRMANILYSRLSGESLNLADRNGGGYKFRGRGLIQLTGKGNYQEFQQWYNALRISKPQYRLPAHDFMADVTATINSSTEELANRQGPNMLFDPKILVLSAIYYFEKKIPKAFLDKEPTEANVHAVTNKINFGEVNDKKKMRHDYVVAARNVFRNTSQCKLIENKPATNSKWRDPVDNPQITIYTQGGKCRPWRSAFGNVRTDLRARDGISPRPHHGLDLFAEIGTSVYACLPGKVVSVSPGTGYGRGFVFKIDDNYLEEFKKQRRNYLPYYVKSKRTYDSNKYDINGFGDFEEYVGITESSSVYLMYAHLSEVLVTLNEEITIDNYKTKILGKTGDTGAIGTKGPHLHFEIRSRLNPSGYSERYNPAFYVNYKNEEQLTTIERNIQDRTANN